MWFGVAEVLKKSVLIGFVFLIAICAASVSAQKKAKPDFTGTWVLDIEKSSDLYKKLSKKPAAAASDTVEKRTETITITHTEPRFEVSTKETLEAFDSAGKLTGKTETILSTLILFTDKRGEINTFQWKRQHSSVTAWDGKKILTAITFDKDKRQLGTIIFALSKDGKELRAANMGISPGGVDVSVMVPMGKVYTRVDQ
jgi:hypothetical protein